MKLVAGLGSIDNYMEYSRAGADEVFVGYVPRSWQEKYGFSVPLNRREVCLVNVQIGSESELEILAGMREKGGAAVTIAFNGISFSYGQYPEIAAIMKRCLELGVESVIIADPGLLLYLHETGISAGLRIHISGEMGEINHFLLSEYRRLGAKRLIFHRKVSLSDMETIIRGERLFEAQNPGCEPMEFEAFLLNENCHFHGGYCNTLHCDELVPMCRIPYVLSGEAFRASAEAEPAPSCSAEHNQAAESAEYNYDYGTENLARMKKIGITHLKIVGRGADPDYMTGCIMRMQEQLSLMR